MEKTRPILNKSNLKALLPLIYLSFLILPNFNLAKSEPQVPKENTIEAIVIPETPSIGDTVSIKVKRLPGKGNLPKIFFSPKISYCKERRRSLLISNPRTKPLLRT